MPRKKCQQTQERFPHKQPLLKLGTLVIVANFNKNRKPYEFGVVVRHTAGQNWLIDTSEGHRIYPERCILPVLETDGKITDAKKAWSQSLEVVVAMARIWQALYAKPPKKRRI